MRILALLALIAMLGCSDSPTQPSPFGDPLSISVTPVYPATDDAQRVDALRYDNKLLEIFGRIVTPHPCYDLSAFRSIAGQAVRVTIVARARSRGCDSSVNHFKYDVLTDGPGDCPHITVVYHFDDGGADLAIYDATICG